jgi:hypothetical protein
VLGDALELANGLDVLLPRVLAEPETKLPGVELIVGVVHLGVGQQVGDIAAVEHDTGELAAVSGMHLEGVELKARAAAEPEDRVGVSCALVRLGQMRALGVATDAQAFLVGQVPPPFLHVRAA